VAHREVDEFEGVSTLKGLVGTTSPATATSIALLRRVTTMSSAVTAHPVLVATLPKTQAM
jgi:hypothetical protein